MSKATTFKTGELVVLKSGGPTMTVMDERVSPITREITEYYCQWFAGKKLEQGAFPPDSLKLAPEEPKE